MIYPPFPIEGSLHYSPKPVPSEAMTSWLLRTSVAHGCSWSDMTALLRRAGIGDPDFDWPWDVRSSASFFCVDPKEFREMLGWSKSFVAQAGAFNLLRGQVSAPVFGLCSHCIRQAKVTHFQVEKRFSFVTMCDRHKTALRTLGHDAVYLGLCEPLPPNAYWNGGAPDTVPGAAHRLALERRMLAVVRSGFERHPVLGVVPAQAVLESEAWRLVLRR